MRHRQELNPTSLPTSTDYAKLGKPNRKLENGLLGIGLVVTILLICGSPLSPFVTLAQTPAPADQARPTRGMSFGGQRIVIGMARTDVMSALSKCCKVTGGPDAFFISERGKSAELVGEMWFNDDKVTTLEQELEDYPSPDAVSLARGVYHELLIAGGSQGDHIVVLTTKTTELTNGTMQEIQLTFPSRRSLVIRVGNVDDPSRAPWVSLSSYQR